MTTTETRRLKILRPCQEALTYAAQHPTLQEAWEACERADWLLWLIVTASQPQQCSPDHRAIVLTTCQCARRTLRFIPAGEARPQRCIEITEHWAKNEPGVTMDDVRQGGRDAYAAYADATYADATYAYAGSADAAYAAYAAAAYAGSAAAANAAYAAAANAAYAAAANAAYVDAYLCALIRVRHPCPKTTKQHRKPLS
jgi:hypothetical protein